MGLIEYIFAVCLKVNRFSLGIPKELTHNRVDTNAQEIKKLVHKLRFYGADVQYKTEKIMVTHSVTEKSA